MDDFVKAMPLRQCDKHGKQVVPEGGIQVGPNRWICSACWKGMLLRRTR